MLDARLLLGAAGEKSPGKELDDDERIAQAVGIQRDDVASRQDLDAEAVVMKIDSNAQDAVECAVCREGGAAVELQLLSEPLQVVLVDEELCAGFVERDLLLHPLVRWTVERFRRQALAIRVEKVGQHLEGAKEAVVKLAKLVLSSRGVGKNKNGTLSAMKLVATKRGTYPAGDFGLGPQFDEQNFPDGGDAALKSGRKEVRLNVQQDVVEAVEERSGRLADGQRVRRPSQVENVFLHFSFGLKRGRKPVSRDYCHQ